MQAKRHKPRYMEALRDRSSGEDTELEFRIGDFIIVLDDTGDMWEVVRGNKCGLMPKDALGPVDCRHTKEDPFPARTTSRYDAQQPDEISVAEECADGG